MIGQRTCRRNTDETRIVMLQIWEKLYQLSPILFAPDLTGPFCQRSSCMEKQMSCNRSIPKDTRVGQLVITPVVIADFVLELGTERGTGAFESTGQ